MKWEKREELISKFFIAYNSHSTVYLCFHSPKTVRKIYIPCTVLVKPNENALFIYVEPNNEELKFNNKGFHYSRFFFSKEDTILENLKGLPWTVPHACNTIRKADTMADEPF